MITIIDSIMGSGKTNFLIDHMNNAYRGYLGLHLNDEGTQAPRFLYVAPLLTEVDRINEACPGLGFRAPKPVNGRKLEHLSVLIKQGANICTTHALFRLLTRDIYEKLKSRNYTLVMDEVLSCVETFDDLTKSDRELLFRDGFVSNQPGTKRLRWNHEDYGDYSGRFNQIRALCDNGNLVLHRNTLLWEFPVDFLDCFDQVFVLTYLFHGSSMSAYLRSKSVDFEIKTLKDRQLVSTEDYSNETEVKERLRSLIEIYDGPATRHGDPHRGSNPFSVTWLKSRTEQDLKVIRAATANWFKKVAGTPAVSNAWTTYKDARKHLSGDRYARGWIPSNAKGTNDYIEKKSLAYLCNVFYPPLTRGYFEDHGIPVHQDLYALSEMLQWIWRSQIRRGDPIRVFIPAARMRNLLKQWLETSKAAELQDDQVQLAA